MRKPSAWDPTGAWNFQTPGGIPGLMNVQTYHWLPSRPENALALPHNPKEAYRRNLEAFPGDPQGSRIKLESGIPQLDIARRTTLDPQWLLEDRAL